MLRRTARRLIDRLVRGSIAPMAERAERIERDLDAARGEADSLRDELARLASQIERGDSASAVLRRDLDKVRARVRDWHMGERLKQLSAIQRDQVELNRQLRAVAERLATLASRVEGHRLGERMAQLSNLQRRVDEVAGAAHSARARLDKLDKHLGAGDLAGHLRRLDTMRAEIDTLVHAQRAAGDRFEELRARIDAHKLGERMAQLSRLEREGAETRDEVRALGHAAARLGREGEQTERRLRDLLERVERWGLGDRVHQVSRIERELRAHADVQRRLDALLQQIAEHTSPEIAWLYKNREERMDARSALWREDRRALHVARYRFASDRVRGLDVADVACGTGYGSRVLADAGAARVLGFDADPGAVEYAQRHYAGGIEFGVADARALPIEDASLDALVSFETIEHLHDPHRFVAEIARVLKPGGVLILSTPNDWGLEHAHHHEVSLDLAHLRRLLECRFEIDTVWGQSPPEDAAGVLDGSGDPGAGFVPIEGDDAGDAECLVVVARAAVGAASASAVDGRTSRDEPA